MFILPDKWVYRFLRLAKEVATWSKDPSTKCGAVIVNPRTKRVISHGFNGYPQNVKDNDMHIREVKYAKVIHAELNSILFAARDLSNHSIFVTLLPCSQCMAAIIQSGITQVYTIKPDAGQEERWGASMNISLSLAKQAHVVVHFIEEDKLHV